MLLDGDGLSLAFGAGPAVVLDRALRPLAFPGEAAVEATLLGGPTRDFNLMVDRSVGGASLRVEDLPVGRDVAIDPGELLLVHVLAGRVSLGRDGLTAGETLLVEETARGHLSGLDALAIVVRAWRHR